MRRRAAAVVISLTGPALLGGCSSQLDDDELRALVERAVVDGTGITPTEVTCPPVRDPSDGDTFECTVTIDGQPLRMTGTVTDASEGSVEVANADAILFVDRLEAVISDDFSAQLGFDVAVDCGDDEVRVEAVGARFTCRASDPEGGEADVVVEVVDADGNVRFAIE